MINLDEQLQRHLHSVADRAEPVPDVDAVFGDELTPRHAGSSTHRRSWVPAAAAIVVVVIGVAGIVAITDLRSPSSADVPSTTPGSSPISTIELPTGSVGVPGMTDVRTSDSTGQSSAFAERLSALLAPRYPDLELREDATRTTDSGHEVTWVYFLDGDRRLFVVAGPSGLLDSGGLRRTADGFEWPNETGAGTIAISTSGSTIIVRSESIEPNGQQRADDDLHGVADLTGELVVMSRAESNEADPVAPAATNDGAVVIPDVVGELSNDAMDQLERLGLSVFVVQSVNPSATFDTVVSIDPKVGTLVPTGTAVSITVADLPD